MRPGRVAFVATLVVVGLLSGGGIATGSAQPVHLCPVCGDGVWSIWHDTEWEPPTESHATVAVHGNGSATWTAELRWANPDVGPQPGDAGKVESIARRELDWSPAVPDPDVVEVEVREGETVVEWRTADVVDERFGHGVLRNFHGEGIVYPLHFDGDSFTIEAPEGQVVTNDPAAGTLSDDRTELTVHGPARLVEEFHVVFGDPDEVSSPSTTLAVGSILWPIAATNVLTGVVPATIVLAFGLAGQARLGRYVDGTSDRLLVASGVGTALVATALDFTPDGIPWFDERIHLGLAAIVVFGYATATGDRRWTLVGGLVTWIVLVGSTIPTIGVTESPFFMLSVSVYTLLVGALVVVGVPGYLFGVSLARRRTNS